MAKFIIEVDDDFIRENAKPATAAGKLCTEAYSASVLKGLFDTIAYVQISKKLDDGVTEFHITRDMMTDDNTREYYDRQVPDVLMMAVMAGRDKKEEKQ